MLTAEKLGANGDAETKGKAVDKENRKARASTPLDSMTTAVVKRQSGKGECYVKRESQCLFLCTLHMRRANPPTDG